MTMAMSTDTITNNPTRSPWLRVGEAAERAGVRG